MFKKNAMQAKIVDEEIHEAMKEKRGASKGMQKIIIASGPVIVNDKNEVLLNQHGDTEFWKFIGGSVPNLEMSLEEVAKMKAKDEMGVDIEITNPEPFVMHTKKETEDGEIDVILVHYLAEIKSEEIKPRADVRQWKWIPISELEKENLGPNILPTLKNFNLL